MTYSSNTSLKLAEILTARICHDLINALSPANNSFDLLQDHLTPQERQEIETFINNSVKQTLYRLAVIRSTLGYNNPTIDCTAISYQKILNQFLNDNLINKAYEGIETYFLKKSSSDAKPKALLILLLCIQNCFTPQSCIKINFFSNKIELIIRANRLIIHQEVVNSFNDVIQEAAITPHTVFCYVLQQFLIDTGIELKLIDFQPQILHIHLIDN